MADPRVHDTSADVRKLYDVAQTFDPDVAEHVQALTDILDEYASILAKSDGARWAILFILSVPRSFLITRSPSFPGVSSETVQILPFGQPSAASGISPQRLMQIRTKMTSRG